MTPEERRNGGPSNVPVRHPKPHFLTVQEVADALRVSRMTVYREIHSGELAAIRVRAGFRVAETALSAYVARHRRSLAPGFRFDGKGADTSPELSAEAGRNVREW